MAEFYRWWRPGASIELTTARVLSREPGAFKRFLAQVERELMGPLQHRQPEVPFFHYTDRGGLEGILGTATIWATEYKMLNDKVELKHGEAAVHAELLAIQNEYRDDTARGAMCRDVIRLRVRGRVIDLPGVNVYVTSFSTAGDVVGQWEQYANKGHGFAIGFKSLPLPDVEVPDIQLDSDLAFDFRRCGYDEIEFRAGVRGEVFRIADALDKHVHTFGLTTAQLEKLYKSAYATAAARVGGLVPFLKHALLVDEREWRLVHIGTAPDKFRRNIRGRGEAEYIKVPLRREPALIDLHSVVVGFRASDSDRAFARATLDRLGYTHVPVVSSKVTLW